MMNPTALPLLLAVALVAGCQNRPTTNTEADRAAIHTLIDETAATNKSGDVAGWVALFEDGAVYMPPNSPAVDTREGLVEVAQLGFSGYVADVVIEAEEIEVFGDWAFARSTVTGQAVPKTEGDTVAVDMKQIVIYHRQSDGTWKIARLIGNRNSYD